jgi:hypothetical protein
MFFAFDFGGFYFFYLCILYVLMIKERNKIMKRFLSVMLVISFFLLNGCVEEFLTHDDQDPYKVVINGYIYDLNGKPVEGIYGSLTYAWVAGSGHGAKPTTASNGNGYFYIIDPPKGTVSLKIESGYKCYRAGDPSSGNSSMYTGITIDHLGPKATKLFNFYEVPRHSDNGHCNWDFII